MTHKRKWENMFFFSSSRSLSIAVSPSSAVRQVSLTVRQLPVIPLSGEWRSVRKQDDPLVGVPTGLPILSSALDPRPLGLPRPRESKTKKCYGNSGSILIERNLYCPYTYLVRWEIIALRVPWFTLGSWLIKDLIVCSLVLWSWIAKERSK